MGVQEILQHLYILPRRLIIETRSREAELPRLRGVWGRALRAIDPVAYERVFHPEGQGRLPGFVLRSAGLSAIPELDFILIGDAIEFEESAMRAWDIAGGRGIGRIDRSTGERPPFYVRERFTLGPDGCPGDNCGPWALSEAEWPLAGDPAHSPCRLRFETPVSMFHAKNLIRNPSIKDITAKGCRRLGSLLPAHLEEAWKLAKAELIACAGSSIRATAWKGQEFAIKRYSGSQRKEFPTKGVVGSMDLAEPKILWPILNSLSWVHVGKGTSIGLGWPKIMSATSEERS